MFLKAYILVLATIAPSFSERLSFTGHRLYSIQPKDDTILSFLQKLLLDTMWTDIDVWTPPVLLNEVVNFRVPSTLVKEFEERLTAQKIEYDTEIDDIQKWIDEEFKLNPPDDAFAGMQENFRLDVYHTYEAINAYMDAIAARYPGIASIMQIGTTFEGNPIRGLKIGSPGVYKPVIWIDGGIHAREWVSPAAVLYFIDRLIKGYTIENDVDITNLVDTFDWYVIPVLNVDGYIFTWTDNRMWRKNRVPHKHVNSSCYGVDLNRNFAVGFGGKGVSSDPCTESYPGFYPFSEIETRAVRDAVLALGDRLKSYINLHSYSQLVMSPYGYTNSTTLDNASQLRALAAMAEKIKGTHSMAYRYGPIATTIYVASGSAIDWVYDVGKVKYSFTIELRDTGKRGFILPREQIIPTAEELFAAIKELTNIIISEL